METSINAIVLVGGKFDKGLYRKCINSLSWTNEIIKVKTDDIKGSFADWRNEGFKEASGDWILYIDTDEEVSVALMEEIMSVIKKNSGKVGCFAIPRKNIIFGKEFKHGGQFPDYQKRLFNRSNFSKWTGRLHEEPSYKGFLEHLKNPITHHKNSSISEMIKKTNKWSELEAEEMIKANHPKMNIFRFFSAGLREFWLRFVKQLSFLDGVEGIIYAMYQVFSRLISYSKLWEKQLSKTLI
ncbi:glycosyltransferase family 2 protein [Candidatus Microgenomates bacterium]|nr:glycosyltransferase family 2 protein [Candidatus Microgenomates bacterium]